MMKKAYGWFLFGLLLCAVLVIGLLPGTAKATDYDLWIGGVQVTDEHLIELDSDGNGWSFDPGQGASVGTLTLKNFTCDVTDTAAIKNSGSVCVSYQLTIILEGKNTIRSGENYDGIDLRAVAGARLYIDGYGSLSVTGGRNGINAGDLEIIGGYLSVYGGTGYGVAGAVHIEREAKYLEITGNNPRAVESYFEIAENITGIGWENADGTGTVSDIRIPDNYQGASPYSFYNITYKKLIVMPRGKLWVGGTEVTPENMKDIPTAQGSTSSGTASYDPVTNTLTLRNYSYHGAGTLYDMANIRCKAGICYADDNATLTVRLEGNNSVMLTGDDNADKAGIYSAGGLRITGSGSLQAEGGPANDTCLRCGIAFSGSLSFAGGTVTAAGDKNTAESWGICYLPKDAKNKTITIGESTVRVMAKGNKGAIGVKSTDDTIKVKVRNSAPGGGWMEYDGSGIMHPIGTRGEADAIEMKDVDTGGWYKTVLFGNGTFPVWVGGTQVTIGNMTDIPAGQGGTKTGKASYQPFTHTLTLDNYSYKGAGYPNSGLDAAICCTDSNPLNLVLSGSNTVIQTGGSADNKAGIYSSGKLTITGDGGLTAKGGAAAKDSYGIYVAGTGFEIEDSSATVTAEGGNAGIRSCGIICLNLENYYPHEEILIKGGTIAAAGGKSNKTSIGIYGWSVHVDAGSVTAAGGTAQDKSEGISALDSIVITSGTVNATGGAAKDYSRGIFAQNTITIDGGMVTAAGGEARNHSEGINAAGNDIDNTITINGGIVTATGGIADESWGFNNSQNNVTDSEAISIGNSITSLTARGLTGAIRQKVKNYVEGAGWLTYYGSGEGTPIRVSNSAQELYETIDNNRVWYQSVNFHCSNFPLWVGGRQVTTANMADIENTMATQGYSTASYDPVTNTITLIDYTSVREGYCYKIETTKTEYIADICYTEPNGILTVETKGSVNISTFYAHPDYQWRYVSAGVFSAGGLKIIINSAAAGARGATVAHESYGICAFSSIEIIGKGAYEFTARGEHGEKKSAGIIALNHNSHIRIKSDRGLIDAKSRHSEESSYGIIGGNIEIINGRVDASSDSYGGDNYGIYCWQSLTIDGGQVNADGSSDTSNSWGISGAEGSTITIRENVKEGEVTYVSASGNQGAIGPVEVLTEIRGEANDGSGTAYEIWEDEAPQAFRDGNTWYKEVTLHGHPFKFELSEDGATITATCIANPCTLGGGKTTLTINAPEELTYDGTPKAATVTDPDKIGRKAEVRYYKAKADGSRDGAELGAAPVNAGTYRAEITLESKVDEAETAYVVYTIEPAELTVTTGGATKTYDSKALTEAAISAEGLAAGETVTLKAIGSQTDAGCSANTYSITWGTALEGNYFITEKLGTLEVTPRELTVTTGGATKTYDSTPLTKDEANIEGFAGSESATVTATGSQTDAGSSANTCSIVWGTAKESNYSVTENLGTLTVEPKLVTLKAENAEKDYDGIALTQPKFPPPSLADGDAHVFAVTMTEASTITKAGSQPNEIATVDGAAVPSGTPTKVGNYLVTTQKGSLIVNPATLTITADSAAKVYDGTELTKDSYRAAGLAQGDRISEITVTGSQTEAGTCDNIPSGIKILNRDGEDVTESYLITPVNGTLAVTRKKLTITAESDTRIYDGTALENEKYSSSDLAEGDQIDSVSVTGSRTETGKAENTPSGARIVNSNGNDVTASYEIAYQKGTLEVTQRPLTVIAESDTKVYDGTALVNSGYSSMGLAQGDGIVSVSVTGSQTEAGEAENTPSAAKILNKDGKDVTGNYRITYRNGTLKVTLNQGLIIIADSAAKVYDGKPLEAGGYKAKGLAEGDRVGSVKITGSQTGAGAGKNIPSDAKILNAQGGDVTANYDISFLEGTLSVTRKVLTVIADSAAKTYDGLPLTKDSFTSSGLAEGDRIDSVKITGSQTRAGTGKNVPSDVKILNAQDEDVTANYEVTLFEGTLEVSRKPLTVTADSAAKAYDGLPLTMESYTVTGLAEGDRIDSVKVTGSQTEVGSGDNTASDAKILNAKGEDVTDCYQSEYKNGVLQVMMRKIATVTADNLSKVYGEADPELTAKTAGTADGGTIAYTVSRVEGEDAGTYAITPSGEKEQGIYTVEYVAGVFTIIKAPSFGTVRAAEGLKADGTEKELVTAEKVSGGTMKYALGDDDKTAPEDGWDTKAPTASAAGTWYVWYKVEGDRNHTDTDPECATVIIAKQERTLTIRYLYTDGSEAAEVYREILTEGKKYSVTAPKITGYQADPKKVSGVMPDEDVLETVVYRMTGSEPSGRTYHAQFISVDDTTLQLIWEPVTGAEGYDIFFIACGDLKAELYDTVTGSSALNSYVFSGLEKGVPYKARVHAWETTTDGKQYIGEMSYQVHAIPGGSNETETDAKEIAIRQKSLVLSAGETKQLDVAAKGYASKLPLVAHGANALTYYSSNSRIAQVDSEGVVTGVAAGTCTVYVTAQNGLRAGVRVTVGNYGFVLPENTKKIDESAFEGIPAKAVYVPDGCTAIGADAFRGCLALKTVRLPKNCKIAANAFRECKALATVTAPAGGTAEQWAKENGLAFIPE